jgi:predicted dehydrogenase
MKKNRFSRREFLQTSAGATGALLAAKTIFLDPEPIFAFQNAVPPSDRIRFGIIGVGMQGAPLLGSAIQLPGVECAAACDLYDGRHTLAKEIVNSTDLPSTRRYQDLLANKDIDCVIAAVPDHWHKQLVVDALNAGKDVYCEKPMSHSPGDGVEMVAAAKRTGRIVQIGSQRVSSVICTKAKELVSQGALGDVMMIEGSLGRNDPTGAWEYPPPTDLSPQTLDWDTWQGTAPKRPFDPLLFARWRCWKEYGTGVAGDLLVHLISGMQYVMGINEPPKRTMATGGILRWKDGRNMPDVHAALFDYGNVPVYMRLNLGTETAEVYRFMGSKGILELSEFSATFAPQPGIDQSPSYYAISFPLGMREEYYRKWHAQNDPLPGKEPAPESVTYRSASWDELKPHLWNFFQAVRTRKPVVEDAVFGHNAALACHMANESYFRKSAVYYDSATKMIKA